jgi:hypothetical protein
MLTPYRKAELIVQLFKVAYASPPTDSAHDFRDVTIRRRAFREAADKLVGSLDANRAGRREAHKFLLGQMCDRMYFGIICMALLSDAEDGEVLQLWNTFLEETGILREVAHIDGGFSEAATPMQPAFREARPAFTPLRI